MNISNYKTTVEDVKYYKNIIKIWYSMDVILFVCLFVCLRCFVLFCFVYYTRHSVFTLDCPATNMIMSWIFRTKISSTINKLKRYIYTEMKKELDNRVNCFCLPHPNFSNFQPFFGFKWQQYRVVFLDQTFLSFYSLNLDIRGYFVFILYWRSVLLVEETGVPGENHCPATSHWQTLSHNVVSRTSCREQDSKSHEFYISNGIIIV
jgi:hypothetical protein